MSDRKLTCIDLFCGCGGLSLGFKEAGFSVIAGIDSWKDALVTHRKNLPESLAVCADLFSFSPCDLVEEYGISKVDVIVGGPPCQGFSIAGKRIVDDKRNKLYKSFVGFVKHYKPKAFVMENVPNLLSLAGGIVRNAIIKDFSSIGYNVVFKVLMASDYGVPQNRRRVFFVGLRNDIRTEYEFPKAEFGTTRKPYVTCEEAISDLNFIGDTTLLPEISEYKLLPQSEYQKVIRYGASHLMNHVATIHTEQTRRIISMVPDGGNYKDLPKELWGTRKVHIAWTRMKSDRPCFTIDCGHNHHFHYSANRVPTVREAARIQSFPDTFEVVGIKTSQLKQVGNAVPPMLAKAVATSLIQVLKRGR